MRFGVVGLGLLLVSGCSSIVGLDGDDDDTPQGPSVADDDDDVASSSSGAATTSSSSSSSSGQSHDAGTDAASSPCPSTAAECLPETVIQHLRSPGELSAVGDRLVFREHAKGDAGSYSVLRYYDPASDCHDAACLTTLDTDENTYRPSAGNAQHLCYTLGESIVCRDPQNPATTQRTVVGDLWWYQAGFVDEHQLLYGSPRSGGISSVRALPVDSTDAAYDVVGPVASPIEHLAVQSDPAYPWFGWLQGDGHLYARAASSTETREFNYTNDIVSIAAVDDSLVWATDYDLHYARYTTAGYGADITGPSFAQCAAQTERVFRSITPGPGVFAAVEGCSIPGSLGSSVVLYRLGGGEPVPLAAVPASISSAVFLGDYVYYAISRIQAFLGEETTEEIRRVRYR